MSFELLQYIRELQERVSALEEQVRVLMTSQRKQTLTLPRKVN